MPRPTANPLKEEAGQSANTTTAEHVSFALEIQSSSIRSHIENSYLEEKVSGVRQYSGDGNLVNK